MRALRLLLLSAAAQAAAREVEVQPAGIPAILPSPGGMLVPGCNCTEREDVIDAPAPGPPAPAPAEYMDPNAITMEVITVDQLLANKVRLAPDALAAELATKLGLPASKIKIIPWSYPSLGPTARHQSLIPAGDGPTWHQVPGAGKHRPYDPSAAAAGGPAPAPAPPPSTLLTQVHPGVFLQLTDGEGARSTCGCQVDLKAEAAEAAQVDEELGLKAPAGAPKGLFVSAPAPADYLALPPSPMGYQALAPGPAGPSPSPAGTPVTFHITITGVDYNVLAGDQVQMAAFRKMMRGVVSERLLDGPFVLDLKVSPGSVKVTYVLQVAGDPGPVKQTLFGDKAAIDLLEAEVKERVMNTLNAVSTIVGPVRAMVTLPDDLPIPPETRVQLLTRDPCLVGKLRKFKAKYETIIANKLGLNKEQVVINPPIFDLDVPATSLLEVRSCRAARIMGSFFQANSSQTARPPPSGSFLSLNARAPAPAAASPGPAPGTMFAPSPGPSPSPAPFAWESLVYFDLTLSGLSYDKLMASEFHREGFEDSIRSAVETGPLSHFPKDHCRMMMRLKPGSIKVEVIIQVAGDNGPVKAAIFHHAVELEALVMQFVSHVPGIADFVIGTLTVNSLCSQGNCVPLTGAVGALGPAPAPAPGPALVKEVNRPWIAWWSVTFMPPNDVPAAEKFMQMVNEQHGPLARVFGLTLARVPGLSEPTGVNNNLKETEFPRPLDTAVALGPRPGGPALEISQFDFQGASLAHSGLPGGAPTSAELIKDTTTQDQMNALWAIRATAMAGVAHGLAIKAAIEGTERSVQQAFQASQAALLNSHHIPAQIAPPMVVGRGLQSPYGPWIPGGPIVDRYGPPPPMGDGPGIGLVETEAKQGRWSAKPTKRHQPPSLRAGAQPTP